MQHNYFVYITTNPAKTVLYIGVTNELKKRMFEHLEDKGTLKSFAGKYYCYNLIYYERFQQIEHAIEKRKTIKKVEQKKERTIDRNSKSQLDFS